MASFSGITGKGFFNVHRNLKDKTTILCPPQLDVVRSWYNTDVTAVKGQFDEPYCFVCPVTYKDRDIIINQHTLVDSIDDNPREHLLKFKCEPYKMLNTLGKIGYKLRRTMCEDENIWTLDRIYTGDYIHEQVQCHSCICSIAEMKYYRKRDTAAYCWQL